MKNIVLHFPLQAPADEIAKFHGTYKAGWNKLREARHAKQIQLEMVDSTFSASPRVDHVSAWDVLKPDEQEKHDKIMAVYTACVVHMQKAVGDLTAHRKEQGVLDNAVILFMSDNGGNAAGVLDGHSKNNSSNWDSRCFCGECWAFLENTPFCRDKHYTMEGGISIPLIVDWTARISAKWELRKQPGHVIDIMLACVDLAGSFTHQAIERDTLYCERTGNTALRVGDLKFVRIGQYAAWELNDLTKEMIWKKLSHFRKRCEII